MVCRVIKNQVGRSSVVSAQQIRLMERVIGVFFAEGIRCLNMHKIASCDEILLRALSF